MLGELMPSWSLVAARGVAMLGLSTPAFCAFDQGNPQVGTCSPVETSACIVTHLSVNFYLTIVSKWIADRSTPCAASTVR